MAAALFGKVNQAQETGGGGEKQHLVTHHYIYTFMAGSCPTQACRWHGGQRRMQPRRNGHNSGSVGLISEGRHTVGNEGNGSAGRAATFNTTTRYRNVSASLRHLFWECHAVVIRPVITPG